MNYLIKVRAQAMPKVIDGDTIVSTNRWVDIIKKVCELKKGDSFLYLGAWYDVESIEEIK